MSSAEDETPPQVAEQVKRRKKQRACDYCRRKKIRCDGADMPDHRCSRCVQQGMECTYEPINTRPPSKSYVQILENRLQNMERLFSRLHPDVQIPKDFDGVLENPQLQLASGNIATTSSHHSPSSMGAVSPPPPDHPASVDSDELDPSEDEREARMTILENLKRVTVPTHPGTLRYHGKSSNLMFLQTVIKQKYDDVERPKSVDPYIRDNPKATPADYPFLRAVARERDDVPYHDFPPPDLMQKLVDTYFFHLNVYLPLLHKPTFEKGIRDNLHLRDQGFGGVVLLVCANGSRFTDDPRVESEDGRVPGWSWFEQVETVRWSILERPRVEDLQACALTAVYLGGTNSPQGSWTVMGLGLRMAQDVGAHRKKMYSATPNPEDELWRRACWVLISLDRMVSFGLGRPCGIHDEDLDLELMTECDDEYWTNDDPELAFKQPEGKPSIIAFANSLIRLLKILAFASRTIYSINKSKQTLGFVGPEWEQRTVAELDSALNKWIDTVPDHLRWDPNRDDNIFMNQSATLYANYYLLQICIHRPFIPSPRKASRLPFPSLTICTNAARSCIHVLDTQFQKNGIPLVLNRLPLFTAGLVLLLNLWGAKRSGLSNEATMGDVYKCMNMLKQLEPHTYSARRLWDVLNGLISIGELSPPGNSAFTSAGRADISSLISTVFASDAAHHGVPIIRTNVAPEAEAKDNRRRALSPFYNATSSRSSGSPPAPAPVPYSSTGSNGNIAMDTSFELPVHTEELGRVPFHHGFSSPYPVTPQQQQQQQEAFFHALQQHDSLSSSTPPQRGIPGNMQGTHMPGEDVGSQPFPMRVTDYSELLSALSGTNAMHPDLSGQQTLRLHGHGQGSVQSTSADADISMMSAENLMFEDHMIEMWSTAPNTLEWDDWGAYVNSMSGVNGAFHPPPPSGL